VEEEDDAAEEVGNEGIRVFPYPAYFIYKQPFMGLSKLQVQINLRAFTVCPEQKIKQR
jgi:hypothetical protein